jgi:hypothetical protein
MVILSLVVVALGCASGGDSAFHDPSHPWTQQSTQSTNALVTPSSTQQTAAESTEEASDSGDFNVDDIKADYVYTSELITILYPLYGSKLDDFVIVTLANEGKLPAKVVVKSEIPGYTDQAVDTVELSAGETLEVRQNPLLLPDVIDKLNVEKPAQVHIQVAALENGDEKTILEETGETTIFARRDFPLGIEGFTESETLEFFAAMVTPNDPSVEELIRKAANYTESGIIWSGYGDHVDDDDGGVYDRLQALWQAEGEYDLIYISTWVSFAPGAVQRIRLPAEVLEQHSGNCIELAMLYAAAAEAMDLEAALILIPGHAYVGIRTDQQNANYYFVETTMIGRNTFSEAVDRASAEFNETMPHLEAQESGYGWVKIWDAREHGILPLPWR